MKYLVYHSKDGEDMIKRLRNAPEEINLKNYNLVAMIESPNVAETFRITNHIEYPWWENPEVIKCYSKHVRSTSVGDVVVEFESHIAHMVMGCGWSIVNLKGGVNVARGEHPN